jgi:hypothetical protein
MLKKSIIIVTLGLILIPTISKSQVSGYEFLRTHVGARPSALGGAFIAMSGDVHSVYYNPSALATLTGKQLTFSYLNHFLDFQSGFVAYGFQMPGIGYLGIGTHYLNYGEFTRTDDLGNESGTFGAGNLVILTDYAIKFSEDFFVGASFKFINSTIAEYNSTALAFDFGLLYQFPAQDMQIGFGVFNAGTVTSSFVESKDDLPLNYRVGATKTLAHLPLMVSVEGYQYIDEDFHFIVGGEFTVTPFLFLRMSYNSVGKDQKIGQNGDKYAGVSIGTGVTFDQATRFQNTFWQKLSFDYSFTSAGNVGTLNRLSIGLRF